MNQTTLIIIIAWIFGAIAVGIIAKKRYAGFWGGFFLGLRFSPIIGLVIVLTTKENQPTMEDQEDGRNYSGW